ELVLFFSFSALRCTLYVGRLCQATRKLSTFCIDSKSSVWISNSSAWPRRFVYAVHLIFVFPLFTLLGLMGKVQLRHSYTPFLVQLVTKLGYLPHHIWLISASVSG